MSDPVHTYLSEIGRKGGSAGRGAMKARTTEQARRAANVRWAKRGERKANEGKPATVGS